MKNIPLTEAQVKRPKKGFYVAKYPNRRTRRSGVDVRNKNSVPRGDAAPQLGTKDGRESTKLGKQTPVEVPPLYGFRSRFHLMAYVLVRRLRATVLALFRYLFVWR